MKTFTQQLSLLRQLNLADWISLSAIIPCIFSYYFLIHGLPDQAIISISGAFLLDMLDGYVARKTHTASAFGRQLDSFVDTLNYLVFTSLLILLYLNFNTPVTIITAFFTLAAGILRLVRFNLGGLIQKNNGLYYTGIIVPFAELAAVVIYFAAEFISPVIIYSTPFVMLAVSVLMISEIPFRKPGNYSIPILLTISIICLSLLHLLRS